MTSDIPIILFVDDDARDRELCIAILSPFAASSTYRTVFLNEGTKVVPYLTTAKQMPRVLVLDLKMPKANGLDVIREVRASVQLFSEIPIVMLSASNSEVDIEECYSAGANAYVIKPMDFKIFGEAVRSIAHFWALINCPGKRLVNR